MKTRVLYILDHYPQLSETYIKAEIEAIWDRYDVSIITIRDPDLPYKNHKPFQLISRGEDLIAHFKKFRPHVMHTHYLTTMPMLSRIAKMTKTPYTARAHSFDALQASIQGIEHDYCLGVLAFPFTRPFIPRHGVPDSKIIDCFPVINFDRFHALRDQPRGEAILNVGACIRKKRMPDFVDLAAKMPGKEFNLYAIGYHAEELVAFNNTKGAPVHMHHTVEPEEMPAVYQRHAWLVYTACPTMRTVGWPLAIAEAQAAGLGVCMARIRPDLEDYLGGAGYLYDSIDELPEILSRPYPQELRERGYAQAKKSDVNSHIHLLTNLWDRCN